MRKYLLNYLKSIEDILEKKPPDANYEMLIKEHLNQLQFMQHERLIHLIVTCLVAILLFIVIGAFSITDSLRLIPLFILLLGLVIPYLWHYYFMENNVQKMYDIYNKLMDLKNDSENQ